MSVEKQRGICRNCMAPIYRMAAKPRLWFHQLTKYRCCWPKSEEDFREAEPA